VLNRAPAAIYYRSFVAHDIFISHSARDKPTADDVCAALESVGIRCWIAPRDVQPGRSFAGEITRGIRGSKVLVLIFSSGSNASDQVLREVQLATEAHLHIIQFRIENVTLNDDLQYYLSTPHWLDAYNAPLDAHVGRLLTAVRALLGTEQNAAEPLPRATAPSQPARTRRLTTPLLLALLTAAVVGGILIWRTANTRRAPAAAASPSPAAVAPTSAMARPQSITAPMNAWANSLGMPFVPLPTTRVLFSIWDTRVQDYNRFAEETHRAAAAAPFAQGPTHPVASASWEDAKAFCGWLTGKERAAGIIRADQEYRLPGDEEWSIAVGLPQENGRTPMEKSGKIRDQYPWGAQWPPPPGAGNYGAALHVDDYDFTSPVGAFAPNEFGLYDMGGNVWQWCEDWTDELHTARVMRGAPFVMNKQEMTLSSCRTVGVPTIQLSGVAGFRCVLAPVATQGPMQSPPPSVPQATAAAARQRLVHSTRLEPATNTLFDFSALVPRDVFEGPATFANETQTFVSNDKTAELTFFVDRDTSPQHFKAVYDSWATEHPASDPDKTVDYKVLRKDWFVASGVKHGNRGYYIKGVLHANALRFLYFECDESDYPIDAATLTAMSHAFDGR
jgi:hypothetical protein